MKATMRRSTMATASAIAMFLTAAPCLMAQTGRSTCNQAAPQPIAIVSVPGSPFTPVATCDGCWLFVTMAMGSPAGVAVMRREAGAISVARVLPLAAANGAVLTHDEKLLIVTGGNDVSFIDVDRLTSGAHDPVLGSLGDRGTVGTIYVRVTSDDQFVFVSNERSESITVINLATARRSGVKSSAAVGKIPVGNAPVGLALSPDGRYLYSTSEIAPASGAGAVLGSIPAGAFPRELRLTADGQTLLLTNFTSGTLDLIDLARLSLH